MTIARQPGFTATFVLGLALFLAGCMSDSRQQILLTDQSAVQLRAVQTRWFETTDRSLVLRNVIATLQDLGFVIDKSDDVLGIVTGTKLNDDVMRMTVTLRPRGQRETAVRASAQHGLVAVSNAAPYQQFFAALENAMFLTANAID